MPACFPAALRYVMTRFGFTQEALAFASKVSESTIGRYRNGKVESFSEKNVVALCVAMHLPPWLSFALIAKAGFSLAATREQLAHLMILNCMYMRSIDEVNEYLRERGFALFEDKDKKSQMRICTLGLSGDRVSQFKTELLPVWCCSERVVSRGGLQKI